MEMGELVSAAQMGEKDAHKKETCPWSHSDNSGGPAKPMSAASPNTDQAMIENDAGVLGKNLKGEPKAVVNLNFKVQQTILLNREPEKKDSKAAKGAKIFEDASEPEEYVVKFAAHHLIPGNAALKGSAVVPFLGDDSVIKEFLVGNASSRITDGGTAGYDINRAENGVWLPGPYAQSTATVTGWASGDNLKAMKKLCDPAQVKATKSFKDAYAFAAMSVSKTQFHFSHTKYSTEVKAALVKIAEKLEALSGSGPAACEFSKTKAGDGKLHPPAQLVARLDIVSTKLKEALTGTVWKAPFLTDGSVGRYLAEFSGPTHPAPRGRFVE